MQETNNWYSKFENQAFKVKSIIGCGWNDLIRAFYDLTGTPWSKDEIFENLITEPFSPAVAKLSEEFEIILEEDSKFLFVVTDFDVEWEVSLFKSDEQEKCLEKFISSIKGRVFE